LRHRLLITARDAAAALHLIEIANAARSRPEFSVEIVTQMPATRYFRSAGISSHVLDLPAAQTPESAEGSELLRSARNLVAELRPDAVLCGLSTPFDGGIDEAMIASFRGPRFVMQDFWGEANPFFGEKADLYFALDDEAVRLSAERHAAPAVVVGSPRHSAYAAMDIPSLRRQERLRLQVPGEASVIGFFGQALHHLEGYRRTLDRWIDAVIGQPGPCIALYRPHPREREEDSRWTFDRLRRTGIRCIMSDGQDVEHALLACDVVCSAFSNCTYDVAYLNYFSEEPLITPVSMYFDEEIISYFRRMVKLAEFPYLKAGLVMAVRDADQLTSTLAAAATSVEKRRYWENARHLANPADAPSRVLDHILSAVSAPSAAGRH
jgi:hypothetical protein